MKQVDRIEELEDVIRNIYAQTEPTEMITERNRNQLLRKLGFIRRLIKRHMKNIDAK